jgi:hypothetical protein
MKVNYTNDSTELFAGFYESFLYNSDTERNWNLDRDFGQEIKDWTGFTNAVASGCVDKLKDNLYQDEDIIESIDFVRVISPKYYNYSTDCLELSIDFDFEKLKHYCFFDKIKEFDLWLLDNYTSYDGFVSFIPNNAKHFGQALEDTKHRDLCIQAMIEFYLLQNVKLESYKQDCFEVAQEALCDFMEEIED